MTDTERDMHFQRAAHLLFNELYERGLITRPDIRVYRDNFNGAVKFQNEVRQHGEQIIAQFAYDLTMYNLKSFIDGVFGGTTLYDPEEIIRDFIPDLTQWPTKDELQ